MKGRKKLIILELARLSLLTTAEIVDVITYYGYTETYRRLRGLSPLQKGKNVLRKLADSLVLQKKENRKEKDCRQNVYQLASKLKREGLVQDHNGKSSLTNKGERKRGELEKSTQGYPEYTARASKETIIVCFDIPETMKGQRAWLRSALRNLRMNMHQRSLWIGKTVLPKKFIKDMHERGLFDYVDIFSVSRGGTLEKLA